jgi:hypothetical protein
VARSRDDDIVAILSKDDLVGDVPQPVFGHLPTCLQGDLRRPDCLQSACCQFGMGFKCPHKWAKGRTDLSVAVRRAIVRQRGDIRAIIIAD